MKLQRKIKLKTKRNMFKSKKNKRSLKKRNNRRLLGGQEKEKCCMCGKKIDNDKSLIPQECLIKHGKYRAHKVCSECWWGEFAKEGAVHKCPGCAKNIPVPPNPHINQVIDLTTD